MSSVFPSYNPWASLIVFEALNPRVKPFLTPDEYKLYSLIYARALASLMADAKVQATTVTLDNNDYKFTVNGQIGTFDGYLKVYGDDGLIVFPCR